MISKQDPLKELEEAKSVVRKLIVKSNFTISILVIILGFILIVIGCLDGGVQGIKELIKSRPAFFIVLGIIQIVMFFPILIFLSGFKWLYDSIQKLRSQNKEA